MAPTTPNGTQTPYKDANGRVVCIGDHLVDKERRHYRINKSGHLVDVIGKIVEGVAIESLIVTHIERGGSNRRLIPVLPQK